MTYDPVDANDDGIVESDVDNESVNTDEQYSDLEPRIDLTEPVWLAETNALVWRYLRDGLDTLTIITSGSGSVSTIAEYMRLNTGSTSGSLAEIVKQVNENHVSANLDWERERAMASGFYARGGVGDVTAYFTTGNPGRGYSGFGFKIDGTTLYGVVHDGSTENTLQIETGLPTNINFDRSLKAKLYPNDRVEFRVDGSNEGELSANIPTGGPFQDGLRDLFVARVENTVAENKNVEFADARVVINP